MATEVTQFREFGRFRLDTRRKVLWHEGEPVPMPLKELELLCVLVERRGELVTKDEMLEAVWPDAFVEESNLSRHIYLLRKTLREFGESEELIQNVPRRGYRFAGEVHDGESGDGDIVIERHALTRTLVEEVQGSDAEVSTAGERGRADGGLAIADGGLEELRLLSIRNPKSAFRNLVSRSRLLIVAAALVAIAVSGFAFWQYQSTEVGRVAEIKSIAVLPFKDFGAATDEDRLGPGLADVLITRLSTLKGVNVRPTSAVLKFDGQDSVAAGRRLEVDAVLEGSIHRHDGRVRVTARLVAVNDRATVWGAQFDEQPKDLFAIQDALSKQVAQALVSDLSDAEARMIAKRPTESIEAYQHYAKGRYLWNKRTTADAEKAIRHFEQA
ncbi:MAG: winged helix-turn-helix domain-containing protein, partial [Pyrinomonadaceae bacterium]